MKVIKPRMIFAAFVALLLCSCSSFDRAKANQEVKETLGMTNPDWNEAKTDYLKKTQTRLQDIERNLSQLKASPVRPGVDASDATEATTEAQEAAREVREELAELRGTGADKWVDEKAEFQTTFNVLESKYSTARTFYR
ncbi:MAG: hypothetical protein COT74_01805 [Bdellovibrionales bacterium CG10_big_fil_rev_8_21_14_0_10_45_34]|nr:MAG: hypothetical protein COT74_01805 [Bdellovibrionales bacterium CG10_big_fil_rev_8_21_14_0_10_45_34]